MNVFSVSGDLLRLTSSLFLVQDLRSSHSASGISRKALELAFVGVCCRYLDLMLFFVGAYNSLMKLFFVVLAGLPVYLCRYSKPYTDSYESSLDSFPTGQALGVCAVLSLLIHPALNAVDLVWSFGVWVEIAAALPQMAMSEKLSEQREGLRFYTALWTLSRALYVFNFAYRLLYDSSPINKIAMLGTIGQALVGLKLLLVLLRKRHTADKKTE